MCQYGILNLHLVFTARASFSRVFRCACRLRILWGSCPTNFEQGVEGVASAVASLTAVGTKLLPQQALSLLSAARQDVVALCGAMARLDDLLAARERAQMARRRTLEQEDWRGREARGGLSSGGGGGGGGRPSGGDGSRVEQEARR